MPSRGRRALVFGAPHALLAAVTYVPLLLTARGEVGADTKQYLYLDPGRLLRRAVSMWDPHIGMGTVTHQTIGYLFPMGPFYWLLDRLGSPAWVAQRIWLATIMFAAGAGVLFLLRTLDVGEPGRTVAALAYALSPYSLHYAARISVILLPWAGLPWMVALVARGLRRGGWRHPALFAIVVALVGGVNATALVYAGLGPVLWFPFAVWVLHEATWRRAAATFLKTGALTLLTSLWWIVGLAVQSGYGLPVLKFTETVETVAKTSLSSESLRGLGYWFFYGRDKLGPWIEPGVQYTQHVWLISVGFALVVLAFAAAVARWRQRTYFVVLLLVGVTFAVGPYPYTHPSLLGRVFKAAANGSTAGLAMRSTGRAVPLVVLALAVLLGVGVTRAFGARRRAGAALAVVAVALVALDLPALWTGTVVAKNLQRPEHIPAYWLDATRWLDRRSHDTRVLEVPGSDFAAYRWGNTVDPITPGLMDRPYVARELIPWGSAPSADLLNALDRRLQEGVLEPQAIAPVARLLSVGDVVLRADLQFERYNTARPRPTWRLLTSPRPAGLEEPVPFGAPRPNVPSVFPMVDEIALALPAGAPDPPPVAAFPVARALPIVRAEPVSAPLLLAGDGEGVVDTAAAGLLDGGRTVLYAASHPRVPADAQLVLTDTNRRRARRWSTVRENTGYTEQAGDARARSGRRSPRCLPARNRLGRDRDATARRP
ncbi:MAG: DUF3367 domain-containing protein [Actinobacteria bacterium]|nr:MAG: DUF3367 domain-containing protein [Actinomycetota bacterium]